MSSSLDAVLAQYEKNKQMTSSKPRMSDEDRLKQYQTSSPHRDYELVKCYSSCDRRESEVKAHTELEKHYTRKGEWFMCTGYNAQKILDTILQTEGEQLGLF